MALPMAPKYTSIVRDLHRVSQIDPHVPAYLYAQVAELNQWLWPDSRKNNPPKCGGSYRKIEPVLNGECTDFVSIEVKQDLIAGTIEATFSK